MSSRSAREEAIQKRAILRRKRARRFARIAQIPRLAENARLAVLVGVSGFFVDEKELQRDVAMQLLVPREIDAAIAAAPRFETIV